jgi:hypothetical protein
MKIAKLINNIISIENIYEMYPNISFPDAGVPDSFLQENNLYKVVNFIPHNEETENYDLLPAPIIKNNIVYTVSVTPKTEEDIRECIDIDNSFSEYEFEVETNHCDLFFYGFKKSN